MNALFCHRWSFLLFLSIVFTWGCAGDKERWVVKGTTQHSALSDIPAASPSNNISGNEGGQEASLRSSHVPDNQKDDTLTVHRMLNERTVPLLGIERSFAHDHTNDRQIVADAMEPGERPVISMLEQDGEPPSSRVNPQPFNNGRNASAAFSELESALRHAISVNERLDTEGVDGEIITTEIPSVYEISQVPLPGIEALAVPGYAYESEAVSSELTLNVRQEEASVLVKTENPAVLPLGHTLKEDLASHDERKPVFQQVPVDNAQSGTGKTHERRMHVPLPTQSVQQSPHDHVDSEDVLIQKSSSQDSKLIQAPLANQSHAFPSVMIPEEGIVSDESSLDDREYARRQEPDDEEAMPGMLAENDVSTENVVSKDSIAASILVTNNELPEVQTEPLRDSLETESVVVMAENEKPKKVLENKKDIENSILASDAPRSSLDERPQTRSLYSSKLKKVQEPSGRNGVIPSDSLDAQRHDVCRPGRTSLRQSQAHNMLAAISRSIQTYLQMDLPQSQHPNLLECFRQRGLIYFQLRDLTNALSDINQVLRTAQTEDIQQARDLFFRGRVYAKMNASRPAIDDLTNALALGMDGHRQAHAYYLRGLSQFQLQLFDSGLKDISMSCRAKFTQACQLLEKVM